jgi:hypothetical protein
MGRLLGQPIELQNLILQKSIFFYGEKIKY